jgi:DNA-binding phage protein
VLALSDVLDSEQEMAISAAFLEIARARGIAQIAFEARLTEAALYAAMTDPANPDTVILQQVINSMLRLLPGNEWEEHE